MVKDDLCWFCKSTGWHLFGKNTTKFDWVILKVMLYKIWNEVDWLGVDYIAGGSGYGSLWYGHWQARCQEDHSLWRWVVLTVIRYGHWQVRCQEDHSLWKLLLMVVGEWSILCYMKWSQWYKTNYNNGVIKWITYSGNMTCRWTFLHFASCMNVIIIIK